MTKNLVASGAAHMDPLSTRAIPGKAHALWDDLTPLWTGGAALLLIVLLAGYPGLQGETREWAQYLALGTIVPLLVLWSPRPGSTTSLTRAMKAALTAACVVLWLRFFWATGSYYLLVVALLQWALLWGTSRFVPGTKGALLPCSRWIWALTNLFVLMVGWSASAYLFYWEPFRDRILQSRSVLLALVVASVLVAANLFPSKAARARSRPTLTRIGDATAILILALASLRADRLFDSIAFHHWGVFTGPAELVRQGGWLLWDAPSQYGFLSILTVAALPARTTWQGFYIAYAVLVFGAAVFLFCLLRALRPGLLNQAFSLALTLAAVFLLPGDPATLSGPQLTPAASAFRFFWCYALLAILVWEFTRAPDKIAYPKLFGAGCVVWLIGTLWSAESAVYCAVIWLPAFGLMVWRRAPGLDGAQSPRQRLRTTGVWLLVPAFVLVLTLTLLGAFYRLRLGHPPDWVGFVEYAGVYSSGAYALPIETLGPVWMLVLVFFGVVATAVGLRRNGLDHPALSLAAGAGGFLWATSSYFVWRSHPANVVNLVPNVCTVIALVLLIHDRYGSRDAGSALIRTSFVPVLTVVLTAGWGNRIALGNAAASLRAGYTPAVERKLPRMNPALVRLMRSADIGHRAPLIYYDENLLPAWPVEGEGNNRVASQPRFWLPVSPFALLIPLPPERRAVYHVRFAARARSSGWLIEAKKNHDSLPLLRENGLDLASVHRQIRTTHTPAKVIEDANHKLTWFEFNAGR